MHGMPLFMRVAHESKHYIPVWSVEFGRWSFACSEEKQYQNSIDGALLLYGVSISSWPTQR